MILELIFTISIASYLVTRVLNSSLALACDNLIKESSYLEVMGSVFVLLAAFSLSVI